MANNITFLQAKANDKLKQKYLDKVVQYCPESVRALVYDPDWSNKNSYIDLLTVENYLDSNKGEEIKHCLKDAYFIVVFPHSLLGAERKSPIFVSNRGFEKMKSEAHFMNSLLDHEALHTDDLMHGIRPKEGICINSDNAKQLNPRIITHLEEVLAYKNQLKKFKEKGIDDPHFKGWLEWELDFHERELYSINPNTELERIVLSFLI